MPGPLPRIRISPLAAVLFAAVATLVACGGGEAIPETAAAGPVAGEGRSGPVRPFAMGFAAVPARLDADAYEAVFDLAARYGDVVMIQRGVPWQELAPGGALRAETEATIAREVTLLQERQLELVYAIDPWDGMDRGTLAGLAPGTGFDDPAVVEAFVAYAELVARRYQPRWLALAVDVDQFAVARPDQVDAFEAAYQSALARVRAVAPKTGVFVTFQLEDLQDLLPWREPHNPQWQLVLRFAPQVDILAVSSFPSFLFPFAADMPAEYYERLLSFGKPLALVPLGYASEPGRGGVTFGTVAGQEEFLERVLREAETTPWELVIWLSAADLAFQTPRPFDLVSQMGLLNQDGEAKPAWTVWAAAAARPWILRPAVEGASGG